MYLPSHANSNTHSSSPNQPDFSNRMRNHPDTRMMTTTLPSPSSSVSSTTSLSATTTENYIRIHIHRDRHRSAQPPQRQQHEHFQHSTVATTTTISHRPASWGNERAMIFHHHADDPSNSHHQSLMTSLLQQQQQQQDRWDDSQLAIELAEDDLVGETVKRRSSARRIKRKLMNSISRQSLVLNGYDRDDLIASFSSSSVVTMPSSSGNRITRSFKKMTSFFL